MLLCSVVYDVDVAVILIHVVRTVTCSGPSYGGLIRSTATIAFSRWSFVLVNCAGTFCDFIDVFSVIHDPSDAHPDLVIVGFDRGLSFRVVY